ncbi:sensor histidine kinase [Wenxinia marina]|uniref:histidine kinase n=1 Tax=Wenxinia marina DSM 24838 TaxID=1123501 RepID=A0A0D0QA63_9RHOB|nr:histidine kinase N-terminal 7TM domain-containing protein [Wenxinia marina]KIQ69187.1 Signal transduction histidine kinase [Wenxinia marina DSM 24838]GGL71029.1 PAS domain-containing sensor histidine kinase [Wenxinia marina]
MQCFENWFDEPISRAAVALSLLALVVLVLMVRRHSFNGKPFYALTFAGVIWTLLCVGFEAASASAACQSAWAMVAWWGNATVPIAWFFFVATYVGSSSPRGRITWSVALVLPMLALVFAATNPWHRLVYTEASVIPPGGDHVAFDHGPGYYAMIALLYAFVVGSLSALASAFRRSRPSVRPLLLTLTLITVSPLLANLSYAGLGIRVLGLDPTAPMFVFGVLVFTWQLATSTTMDMTSAGQFVLFDEMSEPVVFLNRDRAVVRMNAAAKGVDLGATAARLLSGWEERRPDDGEACGAPEHVVSADRVFEPRIRRIESPLDPAGDFLGWSITFVDITDRMAISLALEEALALESEANRRKDDFISMVSHELRTPLTSLKGGVALALSQATGDLSDSKRQLLEVAQRNGHRLSRLIDNLLLAQKVSAEALPLDCEDVDLDRLLGECFEENRTYADQRKVRLSRSGDRRPTVVRGDAFAIRQILDNLVSNAIKFSPEGGLVQGAIDIRDDRVRLSIRDDGRGIADGMEDRVFGRFEQIDGGGSGTIQGSGLGLHISQQLARQMSGDLRYVSRLGAGSTFVVEFPKRPAETLERAGPVALPRAEGSVGEQDTGLRRPARPIDRVAVG